LAALPWRGLADEIHDFRFDGLGLPALRRTFCSGAFPDRRR
jgi:hypothetical protein